MQLENSYPKIIFKDKNNVFVSYDIEQQGCEEANYNITKCLTDAELDKYYFDTSYFERYKLYDDVYDILNIVVFRLVNDLGDEIFLKLYNEPNDYHYHNFIFANNNNTIQEGAI